MQKRDAKIRNIFNISKRKILKNWAFANFETIFADFESPPLKTWMILWNFYHIIMRNICSARCRLCLILSLYSLF